MKKSKVSPVMIEIEQEKLQQIYRELCDTMPMEVRYDEDQLQMANCIIRQMKQSTDNVCIELWNILNPNDISDGSSELE